MKKAMRLLRFYFFSWVVFTFVFFSSPNIVFAVSFIIQNPRNDGEDILIDLSLSGLTSSSCPSNGTENTCYLQAGLTADDPPKYFGQFKNHVDTWIPYTSSPDQSFIQANFYALHPSGGNWSGTLRVKADTTNVNYKGPGVYTIKVWRYTGNSNNYAGDPATTQISLVGPTLTPTPTDTPIPTDTPKVPTPTKTPTSVPTSTKTPTPIPTNKSSPTTQPSPKANPSLATNKKITSTSALPTSRILGDRTQNISQTPKPTEKTKNEEVKVLGISSMNPSQIFIISGGILLVVYAILTIRTYKETKKSDETE